MDTPNFPTRVIYQSRPAIATIWPLRSQIWPAVIAIAFAFWSGFHSNRCCGQIAAIPGIAWPNDPITISFAPDHVEIGRFRNELSQHLNSQVGHPDWQIEMLRAFQIWARHSDLKFALAPDSPRRFGTPGLAQGDPRFGDIRLGAFPQANVLGNAIAYHPNFGAWSGDIFLNTNETYMIDDGHSGSGNSYDLFSVTLHEAGNALGLWDDQVDPASVMFANYVMTRTELAPSDIANIQAIYGAPSLDPHELRRNNDTFSRATRINYGIQFANTLIETRPGRIQSATDRDVYRFVGNELAENCWVKLRAAGRSLLVGQIVVYDAQFSEIARIEATDPLRNTIGKEITNIDPGEVVYIVVEAAGLADFDFGDYELAVDFHPDAGNELIDDDDGPDPFAGFFEQGDEALLDLLYSLVGIVDPETNSNNSIGTATVLAPVPGSPIASRFEIISSLATTTDHDVFRVTSPNESTGTLIVELAPLGIEPAQIILEVLDANQNLLPVNRRIRATGDVIAEVDQIQPNTDYFVRVQSLPGNSQAGNYLLVVDITTAEPNLVLLQQLPLTPRNSDQFGEFTTFKTQLFRFDLSMTPADANQACQLTIYSDTGRVEAVTSVRGGQLRTIYVWLPAGQHIFRFTGQTRRNLAVRNSVVTLYGGSVSDDEGPILLDPSGNPLSGPQIPGTAPTPQPTWNFPKFFVGLIVPLERAW